jgi:DNA-binding FrmR family transcriptional regulator
MAISAATRQSNDERIDGLVADAERVRLEIGSMTSTSCAARVERMLNTLDRVMESSGVVVVEDDRYCIDILTQIAALNTALESLAYKLLDDHVRHCVAGALTSGDAADATRKTEELLAAVQRFAKIR